MKLSMGGTGKKSDDAFLQQVAKQDASVTVKKQAAASAASAASGAGGADAPRRESVDFEMSETINATIDKEGSVSSVSIKGELNLLISDPQSQGCRIQLPPSDPNFSFKTHPAVDKPSFKNNVLTPHRRGMNRFTPNHQIPSFA